MRAGSPPDPQGRQDTGAQVLRVPLAEDVQASETRQLRAARARRRTGRRRQDPGNLQIQDQIAAVHASRCSVRSAHSSRGSSENTVSSMPSCTSPSRAKRLGTLEIVQSAGTTSSISAHVIGVDTVACFTPRTEYALAIVWSRAFWL